MTCHGTSCLWLPTAICTMTGWLMARESYTPSGNVQAQFKVTCLKWVRKAWESVTENVVRKSFKTCEFLSERVLKERVLPEEAAEELVQKTAALVCCSRGWVCRPVCWLRRRWQRRARNEWNNDWRGKWLIVCQVHTVILYNGINIQYLMIASITAFTVWLQVLPHSPYDCKYRHINKRHPQIDAALELTPPREAPQKK